MIKDEVLIPERLAISLNEYLLKSSYLEKLEKIEKINKQFFEDEKLILKINSSDKTPFLNKAIVNSLFYTLEANFSCINQILLGLGEKFFNKKEKEILNKNKINRLFFSNMDIFVELDEFFIKKEIENVLTETISLFNKFYNSNLILKNVYTFFPLISKIRQNYLKNEINLAECKEIINHSSSLFIIFEEMVKQINLELSDFKNRKLKGNSFEIKLSNESFKEMVKYKKENLEDEEDSDYYLCNMMGEDMSVVENIKDLAKPLMYAHLLWYLYWEFVNGGINQFFYNCRGKNLEETIEALEEMGLLKHAKIMKEAVNRYFKKVKKIHQQLNNCMEFFGTYKEADLNDLDEELSKLPIFYIKADKYLIKNKEKYCI